MRHGKSFPVSKPRTVRRDSAPCATTKQAQLKTANRKFCQSIISGARATWYQRRRIAAIFPEWQFSRLRRERVFGAPCRSYGTMQLKPDSETLPAFRKTQKP